MNNADRHKRQNAAEYWAEQTALSPCKSATDFFDREACSKPGMLNHNPTSHNMAQTYFKKYPEEVPVREMSPVLAKNLAKSPIVDWQKRVQEEEAQFKFVGDE